MPLEIVYHCAVLGAGDPKASGVYVSGLIKKSLPATVFKNSILTWVYVNDVAGGKMKEIGTTHWNDPNKDATNETGFSALPGGYRDSNGSFDGIGMASYWWCATENFETNGWSRVIIRLLQVIKMNSSHYNNCYL